jgi:hypothetical protein
MLNIGRTCGGSTASGTRGVRADGCGSRHLTFVNERKRPPEDIGETHETIPTYATRIGLPTVRLPSGRGRRQLTTPRPGVPARADGYRHRNFVEPSSSPRGESNS